MTSPISAALPVRRDLTVAFVSSLIAAVALAAVSIAGLVLGSRGLCDTASPLVQVSR